MIFKENKSRSMATIICLILFLLLEILVTTKTSFLMNFDSQTQTIISQLVNPLRTSIFVVISFLGSPVLSLALVVFIAAMLYSKNRKVDSIWIILTFFSGDAIAFIFKEVVRRARPVDKVVPDAGYSFPSGHIFGLTLLVLVVIYLVLPYVKNQEWRFVLGLLCIIWLLIVAFSRLYLRGHFMSDILGSILLAATWWQVCEMLYLRYYQKVSKYLNLTTN